MICTECRDNDHEHCYDTRHPEQDYRGCACQHHARTNPTNEDKD